MSEPSVSITASLLGAPPMVSLAESPPSSRSITDSKKVMRGALPVLPYQRSKTGISQSAYGVRAGSGTRPGGGRSSCRAAG